MTSLTVRDNHEWVRELACDGAERAAALSDLRTQLLSTLRRAWSGRACVNDELLEDAVQNSLVQILAKLASFQGKARFLTWATTIAVHAVITEMRRRRWSDVSLQSVTGQSLSPHNRTDLSLSPQVQAARVDVLELLNRLIRDELTERQRTVLLAELQGMPLEEIARRLGTNRNAVYKLGHDARKSLKSKLESHGYMADEIADLWTNPQRDKSL